MSLARRYIADFEDEEDTVVEEVPTSPRRSRRLTLPYYLEPTRVVLNLPT